MQLQPLEWPPSAVHDTIAAIARELAYRRSLRQSVLDFRAINSAKAEGYRLSAAKFSYRSARDLIVLVAANLYLEAVAAGQAIVAEHDFRRVGHAAHAVHLHRRGEPAAMGFEASRIDAEVADVTLLQSRHVPCSPPPCPMGEASVKQTRFTIPQRRSLKQVLQPAAAVMRRTQFTLSAWPVRARPAVRRRGGSRRAPCDRAACRSARRALPPMPPRRPACRSAR